MNDNLPLTESEVITRVCGGEVELFEILVRNYNPVLYKIGRSYGFHHQDVEDLMQDAFLAAYRGLAGFERRSSFKTWITRIMLNECYRKVNRFSYKNVITMENPALLSEQPAREDEVAGRELNRLVAAALLEIPVPMRLVFTLRELNGLSTAETADVLGISESNVKVRLNRSKQELRRKIEAMYEPGEIFEFNLKYCDAMVHRVLEKIKSQA